MKITLYVHGTAVDVPLPPNYSAAGIVEIRLDDGRTVQTVFDTDGHIDIRGWGNIPAKLGNGNKFRCRSIIPFEEPTTCGFCYGPVGKCSCGSKQLHALSNQRFTAGFQLGFQIVEDGIPGAVETSFLTMDANIDEVINARAIKAEFHRIAAERGAVVTGLFS